MSLKSSYHSKFDKNCSIQKNKVIKEETEEEEEENFESNRKFLTTEIKLTDDEIQIITEEKKEENFKNKSKSKYSLDEHKIEITKHKVIELKEFKQEEEIDEIFGNFSGKEEIKIRQRNTRICPSGDFSEMLETEKN
jgi:hypothetical protein